MLCQSCLTVQYSNKKLLSQAKALLDARYDEARVREVYCFFMRVCEAKQALDRFITQWEPSCWQTQKYKIARCVCFTSNFLIPKGVYVDFTHHLLNVVGVANHKINDKTACAAFLLSRLLCVKPTPTFPASENRLAYFTTVTLNSLTVPYHQSKPPVVGVIGVVSNHALGMIQ